LPPMDMEKLTEEPEWIFPYDYMAIGESFFIPTLRPAQMTYVNKQISGGLWKGLTHVLALRWLKI